MLPQELRVLWTWREKEDTTKHYENYRTSKGRVAETQVRLENPLERHQECLLIDAYFWDHETLVGRYFLICSKNFAILLWVLQFFKTTCFNDKL